MIFCSTTFSPGAGLDGIREVSVSESRSGEQKKCFLGRLEMCWYLNT